MEACEKKVCPGCGVLAGRLKSAGRDRRQYSVILDMLMELEEKGMIELLAGDCPLKDAGAELEAERHYTVCHYLRCRTCGTVYFVGACIRGTPVYRQVEDLARENIDNRLWGRCGRHGAGAGLDTNIL